MDLPPKERVYRTRFLGHELAIITGLSPGLSPSTQGAVCSRLAPVLTVRWEDGSTLGHLIRPVQRIGDRAPGCEMRRCPMGVHRRLVREDLLTVVSVLVLHILEDVEAEASRLVALRPERVHLDRL